MAYTLSLRAAQDRAALALELENALGLSVKTAFAIASRATWKDTKKALAEIEIAKEEAEEGRRDES